MDVNSYQKIKALFHTVWDPAVLHVVAEAPCGYANLARRLRRDVEAGLGDGSLTRSLIRLRENGLITTGDDLGDDPSSHLYEITTKGRRRLAIYDAIAEAYQRTDRAG